MFYKGRIHKVIYNKFIQNNMCKCSNAYLAAIYLLCADKELWNVSKQSVSQRIINFETIVPNKLTTYGYTLYRVAQDLYNGSSHITLKDICDKYVVSEELFEMILTALRINRKGYSYICTFQKA